MNYEENTIDWKSEDIVIHDADAKTPKMLMRVVGYNEKLKLIRTMYVRVELGRTVYENEKKFLHDPRKFDIKTDLWCADCGAVGWLKKVDGTLLCSSCTVKRYEKLKKFRDAIDKKLKEAMK